MRLVVVDGPDQGKSFELAGVTVLGRDASAGIVIDDPEVSRRHVSISAHDDEVEIEDLESRNGTWVLGERIDERRSVKAGDKIRIGKTVLQVVAPPGETVVAPSAGETARGSSIEPDLPPSQHTRISGGAPDSDPG